MERGRWHSSKYRGHMEGGILMADKIKVNDTTVAEVGMKEVRRVFGKTQLLARKEQLDAELAEVNEFLKLLE